MTKKTTKTSDDKSPIEQSPIEPQLVDRSVLDLAAKVGQRVDIYDIRLVEHASRASVATAPILRLDSRKFKFERDDQTDQLRIFVSFIFALADNTEESKNSPPVFIQAKFALTYGVRELSTFDDDHLNAFAEANGFYNAWPFWREFVYTMLSRMGMPPISLPVFRVVESKAMDNEGE